MTAHTYQNRVQNLRIRAWKTRVISVSLMRMKPTWIIMIWDENGMAQITN